MLTGFNRPTTVIHGSMENVLLPSVFRNYNYCGSEQASNTQNAAIIHSSIANDVRLSKSNVCVCDGQNAIFIRSFANNC